MDNIFVGEPEYSRQPEGQSEHTQLFTVEWIAVVCNIEKRELECDEYRRISNNLYTLLIRTPPLSGKGGIL